MKGKNLRVVVTRENARRRWDHADPEEMEELLEETLETRKAIALRRHLRGCLECSLLAGRLAAMRSTGLEGFE